MANEKQLRVPMPEQEPQERIHNFDEVAQGYTPEQAMEEAARCLHCKNRPCTAGCPIGNRIPEFMALTAEGKFEEAYRVVREKSCLPAITGRVCSQETQCEQRCVRGIKGEALGIGRIERFLADWAMEHGVPRTVGMEPENGRMVAVVGSGPAGLTCAGELRRRGYGVTVFEALHEAGGILRYGIPEFRLPNALVQREIDALEREGVKFTLDALIGRSFTVDELFGMGYEAVFLGTGANMPGFMNIPGESLIGVYAANEYLARLSLMRAFDERYDTPVRRGKKVAVVGGGNVAMDAARSALRLGAQEVSIIYRRSAAEMPSNKAEADEAAAEGVVFRFLTNPVRILGNEAGEVSGIECVEMELGEPDASGRRRPVEKKGSNFRIEADTVVMSIGTSPHPLIRDTTPGVEADRWNSLVVDEEMRTSREGVWAAGDLVTGALTVVAAVKAAKTAAESIDAYLRKKQPQTN